jgi:von Willebrand factor type A domain
MRFLRPDLLQWWLVIPVLIASCGLHWRFIRAFRLRTAIDARFAPLSRRTTWRRDAAVCIASVLGAAAIVFALMRPQVLLAHRVPEYERQDLIIMLDRSLSMQARDILPSRFSRATVELRNLLRQKPEGVDRIGLVGFADSSLVLSYLTGDIESVLFYLDWLDSESSTLFGTNIGAALKSAADVAKKDDRPTRKRFLLVSDGEDYGTELTSALNTFRAEGYRVDCIGIGSEQAVPIPLNPSGDQDPSTLRPFDKLRAAPSPVEGRAPQGRPEQGRAARGSGSPRATSSGDDAYLRDDAGRRVMTKFEEATLVGVAAATGGRYVRSTTGTEVARAIGEVVKGDRRITGWRSVTDYRDLYPVVLAVAAVAAAALCFLV